MLTFAVLVTLIHVNNAETCQEMESKSTVAASFVQTRRIEGKMIANEKEEAFLGADPQWFPNKHGDAQIEATNTTFYIEKCNAGTDPKKKMLEDARISHATCRSEQQTINGSNVSQNCYGEKKAACDSMQSIFEESYCTYAESKEDYCKEFEACHAAANSAHASAKQKVEQQEQDLREMFIQHTRLECKIAAWPLTTSSKSGCDGMTVATSHLGVTHPAKPVPPTCTYPVAPVPGVNDWFAAEYSSKSWVTLVEPVKPCTTTTTVGVMMTDTIQTSNSATCALFKDLTVHCNPPTTGAISPQLDGITDVESWSLAAWGSVCFIQRSTKEVACKDNGDKRFSPPANLGQAKQIKTGSDFACAILMDDTVKCWGRSQHGSTRPPANLGEVTYLVTQGQTACAIRKEDDKPACWGDMRSSCPSLTNVKEIAMSAQTCCNVMKDDTVRCRDSPNPNIPADLKVKQLRATDKRAFFALLPDDTVQIFGQHNAKIPADLGKVLWFYESSTEDGRTLCAKTENGNRCWNIHSSNYVNLQINGVAVNELDV